jgi:hypothetical protein
MAAQVALHPTVTASLSSEAGCCGAADIQENLVRRLRESMRGCTAATAVEIWFQDEAGVGQQGSLSHVRAPIGSRPPLLRDARRDSVYLFGAICPQRAVGAAVFAGAEPDGGCLAVSTGQ